MPGISCERSRLWPQAATSKYMSALSRVERLVCMFISYSNRLQSATCTYKVLVVLVYRQSSVPGIEFDLETRNASVMKGCRNTKFRIQR